MNNLPPSSLDTVSDGTTTGARRINQSEMNRACETFFRSRNMSTRSGGQYGRKSNKHKSNQSPTESK